MIGCIVSGVLFFLAYVVPFLVPEEWGSWVYGCPECACERVYVEKGVEPPTYCWCVECDWEGVPTELVRRPKRRRFAV